MNLLFMVREGSPKFVSVSGPEDRSATVVAVPRPGSFESLG